MRLHPSWVVVMLLLGGAARAAAPARINLQGVLRSDMGGLQDGMFSFRVRLFPDATSTTAILDETYAATAVNSGVFSFEIGGSTTGLAAALAAATAAEAEISIDGVALPRQPLSSVAYALHAETAVSAQQVPWSGVSGVPAACGGNTFLQGFAGGAPMCGTPVDNVGVTMVTAGGGITGSVLGSTLTLDSDTTVQRRTASTPFTCTGSQVIQSVTQTGAATCITPPQGTVTSVASGTGLTGGPITASGTLAVDTATVAIKTGSTSQTFDPDTNTLHIDFTNGRVGVRTTSPSEILDVVGWTKASAGFITDGATGRYAFTTARAGAAAVPASAFVDATNALAKYDGSDGFLYSDSTTLIGSSRAAVHLPQAATVTDFTCYLLDGAPSDLSFTAALKRRAYTDTGSQSMAALAPSITGTSVTMRTPSTSAITANTDVVDNLSYSYWIDITMSTTVASSLLRFYGCKVGYTVLTMEP